MNEREEFIAAVNSSEAAMRAIEAKEAENDKWDKWKEIHKKVFHPPVKNGMTVTVLGFLLRILWRFLVFLFWFYLLDIGVPMLIEKGIAALFGQESLPQIAEEIIWLIFGTIFWALPVYGLLIFFYVKKKKLEKETAVLQQDPSLSWIPETFRIDYCFGKLREYVQYNRAGSIREALNLLENDYNQTLAIAGIKSQMQ